LAEAEGLLVLVPQLALQVGDLALDLGHDVERPVRVDPRLARDRTRALC
jgi:hypothetical protein